jgi:diguanylate cyclase (GGDEF)-like protein
VLKEVAGAFQRVLRRVDLLGRLGGEEFGVLLPQTAIAGGTVVAEKLRASVEAFSVSTDAGPVTVTASFGVTEARRGEDLEQIVQRADKGLYRAKSAGRNRVMAASAR